MTYPPSPPLSGRLSLGEHRDRPWTLRCAGATDREQGVSTDVVVHLSDDDMSALVDTLLLPLDTDTAPTPRARVVRDAVGPQLRLLVSGTDAADGLGAERDAVLYLWGDPVCGELLGAIGRLRAARV